MANTARNARVGGTIFVGLIILQFPFVHFTNVPADVSNPKMSPMEMCACGIIDSEIMPNDLADALLVPGEIRKALGAQLYCRLTGTECPAEVMPNMQHVMEKTLPAACKMFDSPKLALIRKEMMLGAALTASGAAVSLVRHAKLSIMGMCVFMFASFKGWQHDLLVPLPTILVAFIAALLGGRLGLVRQQVRRAAVKSAAAPKPAAPAEASSKAGSGEVPTGSAKKRRARRA